MPGQLDLLCYRERPLGQWLEGLQDRPLEKDGEDVWPAIGQGIKAAVQQLTRMAGNPNVEVRRQGVRALRELGEQLQWVVPALERCLKEVALDEQDPGVRTEAIEALSQHLGPHAGLQPGTLIEALREEVPAVRLGAARALAELGPRGYPALPPLIHAAHWDPDPAVRVHAAVAIWKIDHRDRIAVPVLIRALGEPDECLRWVAADCLGDMGADAADALPALRVARSGTYRTPLVREALRLAQERIEQAVAGQ